MRCLIRPLLMLLMAFLAVPALAQTRSADEYFFQPSLGDLQGNLTDLRHEGKTAVLLMFEQADCPFCERMEHTVLNQVRVQNYYRKHFIIHTMDIRGDDPITDFSGKDTTAKAFSFTQRARATPTFVFYGPNGKELTRFTGLTQSVDQFMLLGQYVVDGAYKKEYFNVYMKQHARPGQ